MARVRKRVVAEADPTPLPVAEAVPEPEVVPTAEAVAEPELEADAGQELRSSGTYEPLYGTGLTKVLAIARRELSSFFVSPIGWVITPVVMLFVSWFGYIVPVLGNQQASMDGVFSLVAFSLSLLIVPLVTMRVLADERRQGTLEMLLTSPVRDWELVAGKWLGSLAFLGAMFSFTLVYVVLFLVYLPRVTFHLLGVPLSLGNLDFGLLLSGYLGLLALAAAFAAVGVLCSSLTQNQIVAAFLTFGALIFIYYCGLATQVLSPPYSDFFQYVGGQNRYSGFSQGQVALKDVVYFLSLTFGSLFLATRVLESRKWR
ncbi:MAG TPA: ABC transporter permease [Candidatus Dormibacteraeota bacterium]|jgi:ABC-2 type transport system permease protein